MLAALHDPNGDGDPSDSIADNTVIFFTSDNGGTGSYDNLPLKGKKGMFTEGGIRVPLIAHWPGVLPPDTVTDYKVHSVDYYPTCLELAGGKWLPSEKEHPLTDIPLRMSCTNRTSGVRGNPSSICFRVIWTYAHSLAWWPSMMSSPSDTSCPISMNQTPGSFIA
jgi:hypothetical protein